jgi:hypothetical protein
MTLHVDSQTWIWLSLSTSDPNQKDTAAVSSVDSHTGLLFHTLYDTLERLRKEENKLVTRLTLPFRSLIGRLSKDRRQVHPFLL